MPDKLRTIIIEDELLAREGLLDYIQELDFLEVVAVCHHAIEATDTIIQYKPHLVFLDIHMPRLSGIEFLKSFTTSTQFMTDRPLFILTTAYPNYALESFELDVVDYLVKPYSFSRFLKAVNKAYHIYQLTHAPRAAVAEAPKDHIFVQVEYKLERVNFEEILYLEGQENYVKIHCKGRKLMTMTTMKYMEDVLPDTFIRVHKSYIVNYNAITTIEGSSLYIQGQSIPISRNRRQELMDRINR
jgi:DNA-binding LytR/AlgR family response regulator